MSLAHNGVLFLDELPEFGRSVLEVLRQPLEEKRIVVSRARYSVAYPANFMLVAAMNPCPGAATTTTRRASASARRGGPPLHEPHLGAAHGPYRPACGGDSVLPNELSDRTPGEPSAAIRERVVRARAVQEERFRGVAGVHTNAMMNSALLNEYCRLDAAAASLLERAMERLSLSGPGLRSHPQGSPYDRRPGRPCGGCGPGYRRGDQLPVARPRQLGALSVARAGTVCREIDGNEWCGPETGCGGEPSRSGRNR